MEDESGYELNTLPGETTSEGCSCGSSNGVWIVIVIILFLALVALAIWSIWYYYNKRNCTNNNNSSCDSDTNKMSVTGVKLNIASNTSVTATWNQTNRATDNFVLYASLDPPILNNSGTVTNAVTQSSVVSNGSTTATVSGLQARLKYYITLIGTNTLTTNYFLYTQIVYMLTDTDITEYVTGSTGTVFNTFSIADIIQIGKIQVVESTGTNGVYQVQYSQTPVDAYSLYFLNNQGQLQLANANVETTSGTLCLYNNNGTLNAQDCTNTTSNLSNGTWTYSPIGYANQWCLSSSISTTGASGAAPTCMVLGKISSQGVATVSVNNNTTAGDAWSVNFQS